MKKILSIITVFILVLTGLSSCGLKGENQNGKLKVMTTIFPQYDFAKKIGGDKVEVKMLLKPGAESHTFSPTPQEIKEVGDSDIFIFVGGENDSWVKKILEGIDSNKVKTLKLLDMVKTLDEEIVEGMEDKEHDHDKDDDHDDHDKDHDSEKDDDHDKDEDEDHDKDHDSDKDDEHDHEIDEHVWTSPKNALVIAEKIKNEFIKKDKDNKEVYEKNFEELSKELKELDKDLEKTVSTAKRKTILFGDRFPFRYLAHDYGLKYYAAFSGCSTDTEASAQTVTFLIGRVQNEKLPVVFTIEMSNEKIADSIAEATGAKKLTLHSAHNLSEEELKNGITYIDIMKNNIKNLEKALNE